MSDEPHDRLLAIPPATDAEHVVRAERYAMACTWGLYVVGEDEKYARQAARAAFGEVDRIEQELSRFVEHSDVARINALPAGGTARVGIETLECLELAARVHEDTGGAFDVTVGVLLNLPGPHKSADSSEPPIGMHLLEINRPARSVSVRAEGLVVDLGGIGKGYALDRVLAVLREWGIDAALVHCGQSTACATGRPAGQDGWEVALRSPADQSATLGSVRLRDHALSGSGARLHGRHIIDPRTGRPADGTIGAWALAPSAALADALSTAFMVLSPNEVADYCRRHPDVSGVVQAETPGVRSLLRYGRGFDAIDTIEPG